MIVAKSQKDNYITNIQDGEYQLQADGRNGIYQRPTNILASSYAACTNITVRKILDKRGLSYDEVIVYVDFEVDELERTVFYLSVDIIGNIEESIKEEIVLEAKDCSVCKILKSEKQFLPLKR